jgi:tRNA nucleotidyltransferase/poly(A) polymerase
MSNITNLLDRTKVEFKVFEAAGKVASNLNYEAYAIGGYVRDAILGHCSLEDYTDIDITVRGDFMEFTKHLAKELNIKTIVPFEKFKTARLVDEEYQIEIAETRKESYYKDSRKPVVESTTLEQDLLRRDFTINAIAMSLNKQNFGEIIDPLGGIKDLNKGIIITPLDPDETFSDDPLRMLRAVRFAARLDFQIANNILDSIDRMAKRLDIISWERITEEVIKCLKTDKPSIAFYLMKDTGLLNYVFPEMNVMSGIEIIDGKSHKDVFIHTLQVVDNAAKLTKKMEIRFAALVHDIAKPPTKRFDPIKGWTYHGHEDLGKHMIKIVSKRMKLSNDLRNYLMNMTKLHLRPIALAKKDITDSAIRRLMVEAGDNIDDLMILCRADITTKNKKKVDKYINNFNRVEQSMQDVKLRDDLRNFQSPVNGVEIMKLLNLKAGQKIGEIKKNIEEAILNGEIDNTYDAALGFLLKNKEKFL